MLSKDHPSNKYQTAFKLRLRHTSRGCDCLGQDVSEISIRDNVSCHNPLQHDAVIVIQQMAHFPLCRRRICHGESLDQTRTKRESGMLSRRLSATVMFRVIDGMNNVIVQ